MPGRPWRGLTIWVLLAGALVPSAGGCAGAGTAASPAPPAVPAPERPPAPEPTPPVVETKEPVPAEKPFDPAETARKARAALDSGDFDGAIALATRCIDAAPDKPAGYYLRGGALWSKGETRKAIRDYTTIIALSPRDSFALCCRGDLRSMGGDADGATSDYRAALGIDPALRRARLGLGRVAEARGDLDAALEAYSLAVALDPGDPEAYEVRGWLRIKRAEHVLAIADFSLAMARDPKSARLVGGRAEAKRKMRDYEGALADYRRAAGLAPGDPDYRYNCGITRVALDDYDGAIADFTAVLGVDPGYQKALKMRAKCSAFRDPPDLDAAAADIDRALALRPVDAHGSSIQALIRWKRGDTDGAQASVDEAVRVAPDSGRAHANRAQVLYDRRLWREALAAYRTAFSLDAGERDYALFRIWILRSRLGEREAATREVADYLKARPRGGEDDGWIRKLLGLYAGTLTEEALLNDTASATPRREREKRCEAYFYAGMRRLVSGDPVVAGEYLKKCREARIQDFLEYDSAAIELEDLAAGK